MKLSLSQQVAVHTMRNGYELGYYYGITTSVLLQKGGCGKGGVTSKILMGTFRALQVKNLIRKLPTDGYRLTRYELTELGNTIELDLL